MSFQSFIGLRVLNSTKERVQAAAEKKGVTVSEFIRNAMLRDARITLVGDRTERGDHE